MSANNRLKIFREQLGLTQEEFGKPLGLKRLNITNLESGKVKISTLHTLAMEYIYDLNKEWLLHGKGDFFIDETKISQKEPQLEMLEETKAQESGVFKSRPIRKEHSKFSVVEQEHIDLIHRFKDKETAKDVNEKLIDIERMSETNYRKAVSFIGTMWENVTDVFSDLREKKNPRQGNQKNGTDDK